MREITYGDRVEDDVLFSANSADSTVPNKYIESSVTDDKSHETGNSLHNVNKSVSSANVR